MDKRVGKPFEGLGTKLKALRERKKESIAEVSGAVEIEVGALEQIELGSQRPAEEILALLISYFGISDEEAESLWKLAGYEEVVKLPNPNQGQTFELNQATAMVMPMDLRVVYTDMVHVMINDFGVIMNFMQGGGPNQQPLAVARIGMSKEHAKSVLEILDKSLKQAEKHQQPKLLNHSPKQTPGPQKTDSSDK